MPFAWAAHGTKERDGETITNGDIPLVFLCGPYARLENYSLSSNLDLREFMREYDRKHARALRMPWIMSYLSNFMK